MAAKDSFDAFVSILRDKINGFSEDANEPNLKIIQNELKDKFDDLVKSQGYVSNEEYEALNGLAQRLEQRVSKLEELLEQSKTK
jgi:polyhydroxyalkanoate synthesis regulator phasin